MAFSDWSNISSVEGLIETTSSNTDGLFGIAVWGLTYVIMYLVILMAIQRQGATDPGVGALLPASIVMSLASFYMGILGWIDAYFTVAPVILSVIGFIISYNR